jgi:hypothetical protein
VIHLVEAELNQRFPGRADRRATDPDALSCLHVILEGKWEHHRYAVRDLDAIEAEPGRSRPDRATAGSARRRRCREE